jgi:hypothetical protein
MYSDFIIKYLLNFNFNLNITQSVIITPMLTEEGEGISPIYIISTLIFLAFYAIVSSFLEYRHYPIHKGAVAIIIGIILIYSGIIAGFIFFFTSDDNYKTVVYLS